ncbi:ImmA/IrrE family metallo-endopeptidase [Pseudovibrio sp. SPO723]|uniref:ImmA/IrrE family metallo-endopeptidase n=1 Tax=Nesiotobacter zosterae TaxID=392721 RepID=UPI0029C20953|nr:ImmA/IrrE family metallo-endopeptidase [Pseudovibrio sp. SPO723]MDX5595289.1 ImmA/IrrE family metallo-endopeptidase [Pseudovibrio sp. SPO723]
MSKGFRHGFKAEAENYATLFREELGKKPHEPLCPRILAEHLCIPVRELSTHPGLDQDVKDYWRDCEESTFSGLILNDGSYKEIVHNDYHHQRRQNSNIAHELAHVILGHPLSAPIKPSGERAYDKHIEDEAKWLGAALLIPKKAAIYIVLNSISLADVQQEYGVSEELLKYRVQVTDAYRAASNIRRIYRR